MTGPQRRLGRATCRVGSPVTLRHRRWWQAAAIGGALAAITASVWQGPAALASAKPAPSVTPILLLGEGSFDVQQEIHDWDVGLYGKTGTLSTDYLADGGYIGKQDYLAGTADYVISGVGFSPSQLKSLPGGPSDVIAAPIMPSAVGFMFQPPTGDFDSVYNDNPPPTCVPTVANGFCAPNPNLPTDGTLVQHYDGPYNIPYANITAMMLDYDGTDPTSGALRDSYEEWDDPAITKTWPGFKFNADVDQLGERTLPSIGPLAYGRSDPNETNYYLQQMMISQDPAIWKEALAEDGDPSTPTLNNFTETLPAYLPVQVKQGSVQQVEALLGNAGTVSTNGTVADVPPSAMAQVDQFNATQKSQKLATVEVQWLGVQNAERQYLDPTPATVDASIDAGGATPLYALDHRVKNGYPLTYVDDLYAPAHGLSQAKTEAIATLIRYLVTDGQSIPAKYNDGRLSPALVQQALAAANRLVDSNCTGSDESIITSLNPGPYAPSLPGIDNIGSMDNCVPASTATLIPATTTTTSTTVPATTTTTTAAPTTTTPSGSVSGAGGSTGSGSTGSGSIGSGSGGGGSGSGSGKASGTGSTSTGSTTTPKAKTAPTTARPAAPAKATITGAVLGSSDLEIPGSGGGFDHLAALLIGAALFLLARRPLQRLIRVIRS